MRTLKMILLAGLAFMAVACEKESDAHINVPESIALAPDADKITFTVSSNVNWTMKVSDPWFKITPKLGRGETTVTLGVDRNISGASRSSAIEFTCADGTTVRVPVSQTPFVAEMDITAPASVVVEKGKQLTINVESNSDDWEYTVTDGDWLKKASADPGSITFDLDPSVRFSESVPAKIAFTSLSDPLFNDEIEILPVDFVEFTASAPETLDLDNNEQLTVAVTSNIDDWTYEINEIAWLNKASETSIGIVFNSIPNNLLDPSIKAKITFSSASYANLSYAVEIAPVSSQPPVTMVAKNNMRAFVLANDGVKYVSDNCKSEYLFDGKRMTHKEGWGAVNYQNWQLSTTNDQAAAGHGDSFTIDAGETIKLAKFVTHHYYNYTQHDPLEYEIYAYTGTQTDPEADWANWTLLGHVDVTEVSAIVKALPAGAYSWNIAVGDILHVPESTNVQARYYRFKMLLNGYNYWKGALDANWSSRTHWLTISEITMYAY